MYALPGKHDIDPNAIMAFFYYCFFGMMFSDAGYGLIMFLATLFILLKCKPEGQKRKTVMMYMYCGISTMFWGIMFGSFFGDIINIVRYDFIGLPKIRLYAWLDPQEQLMTTMLWCFLFGVVHLFVGVGIKGYMEWRDGQRFWAVCDTLSVYLAVGGALPLCAGMIIDVPSDIKTVGKYCAIAGVIIIVLTAGRESKSFFRQNRLRTLRRVQHDFGLSQRYSFIRKAFGTRTCYRHNRQRSQYDGCFAEQ